jgi:hypothetical protein
MFSTHCGSQPTARAVRYDDEATVASPRAAVLSSDHELGPFAISVNVVDRHSLEEARSQSDRSQAKDVVECISPDDGTHPGRCDETARDGPCTPPAGP